MRRMSFAMNIPQFKDRTKTVTRRFGWWHLKPGDEVMGVERSMGLKRGQHMVELGVIRVVSVKEIGVRDVDEAELVLEGCGHMTVDQYITMLIGSTKKLSAPVNRIEFEYID